MRVQVANRAWHTVYLLGPLKFETWKTSPDASPMFWIYPRPRAGTNRDRALQLTVWRRKFEFRWKRRGGAQ